MTRKKTPAPPAGTPPGKPPLPTLTGDALATHMKTRTDEAAKKKAMRMSKKSMRQNAAKAPAAPSVPVVDKEAIKSSTTPEPAAGQAGAVKPSEMKGFRDGVRQRRERTNEWGLTDQHELFAHEYCRDLNAKQAAIRAGYSAKSAHVYGSQLLENPKVWQRVQTLKQEVFKKIDLTHERILRELSIMAFANMSDFLVPDGKGGVNLDIAGVLEHGPHLMAAITGYEIVEMEPAMELDPESGGMRMREVLKHKIKMDKMKALELLMKHKQMFSPDEVLSPEQLEELLERQKADLRRRRTMLMARLAIENKSGEGLVPVDIQDAEFETVEN